MKREEAWERDREVSRSKDRCRVESSQLKRVRSSEEFMASPLLPGSNRMPGSNQLMIDSRIDAINKKLQSHKSTRNLHSDSFSQNSFSYVKAGQNPI